MNIILTIWFLHCDAFAEAIIDIDNWCTKGRFEFVLAEMSYPNIIGYYYLVTLKLITIKLVTKEWDLDFLLSYILFYHCSGKKSFEIVICTSM